MDTLTNSPNLVENSVKHYLHYSLDKCHQTKMNLYSQILNIGVFLFFLILVSVTLYFCWKKKPSKIDLERKMLKDQEFILSKIRYFQQVKQHEKELLMKPEMATNLPLIV
jgi:hypothetical protein